MTEWMPQVVKLEKIERHPNAETLEMCDVLGGYKVIFKEGRFKEGDLAAYIPVDTICSDHPEFAWLGDKKRIKAARLRGIFSLGILAAAPESMLEGDSVVDFYGLKKHVYEEEEPDLPGRHNGDHASPPKGWAIPHYDLDGLRKSSSFLQENEEVVLTEKIEGCNASFGYGPDGDTFWVKSRNHYLKEDPNNLYWQVAKSHGLHVQLQPYPGLIFFGEIYGQVKGFKYDCTIEQGKVMPKVKFFDIWDVKTMKFLDWDDMERIVKEAGLETVPVLYRGPWTNGTATNRSVRNPLWDYAEGQSAIGSNIKEGFVVRPTKERADFRGNRIILKLKGEEYYLKKK